MSEAAVSLQGVEYVEYAVRDLDKAAPLFERQGFQLVGTRTEGAKVSRLYMQGDIRFVLTASSSDKDAAYQFTRNHGDGVLTVGYRVANADEAYRACCQKGARGAYGTENLRGKDGAVQHRSAIQVYGDVRNSFVSYDGSGRFEDQFTENQNPLPTHKGKMLQTIDHITVNVEKGQVGRWSKFYNEMFGFSLVRTFDIRTDKTGLFSEAIRNPNGRVTMPFNEPTNDKSQIQEFIDTFHGPGVQHIALHTSNILTCLSELKDKQHFKFLTVPDTYYDAVPKRVPNVAEDMKELMKYAILVDGSDKGYLLQIFTENVMGPFFFEYIQRKGDNGFGDGNFRALFEAIERDQIRRGVLS
ncbi:MAG: 4-hydroxyphenylpyruvate dioxygenase [Deltaproteobacteria bacterium]|nr:4-hydroxyphenylpyruvate dioxygenase [Deltaproteobacteria bacterium]